MNPYSSIPYGVLQTEKEVIIFYYDPDQRLINEPYIKQNADEMIMILGQQTQSSALFIHTDVETGHLVVDSLNISA